MTIYTIKWSSRFKKDYKSFIHDSKKLQKLQKVIEELSMGKSYEYLIEIMN